MEKFPVVWPLTCCQLMALNKKKKKVLFASRLHTVLPVGCQALKCNNTGLLHGTDSLGRSHKYFVLLGE